MGFGGSAAIVAGGASGLGEATVRRLHGLGAGVVIADLNVERGHALAAELGDRAGFLATDVTDPDGVKAAIDAAAQTPGGLRISVCCAGIGWAERVAGRRGDEKHKKQIPASRSLVSVDPTGDDIGVHPPQVERDHDRRHNQHDQEQPSP